MGGQILPQAQEKEKTSHLDLLYLMKNCARKKTPASLLARR